jgi:hypothetical protein
MANAFADLPVGSWEDGSTLTGTDLRRGQLFSTTGGALALTARGGVRPSRGNPLGASLPGGMFVRVQPGVAAVPAAASEGAYVVTVAAVTDLAVTAANGTNPRIDTLGLEVVPGSPDLWRVRMLDGTPNASPVAPTYAVAGGVFLPLADIRVNAGVTSPTSVTDRRTYTAAAGGVVPIPGLLALSKASRDALMAALPPGTLVYDDNANALGVVSTARNFMPIQQDPAMTNSGVVGPSPSFSNTTWGEYTTVAFTFTPPRSGNAYIGYQTDVSSIGAPGFIMHRVMVDGSPLFFSDVVVAFPPTSPATRYPLDWVSKVPVYCEQGVARSITLQVQSFNTGQTWLVNQFQWRITQV